MQRDCQVEIVVAGLGRLPFDGVIDLSHPRNLHSLFHDSTAGTGECDRDSLRLWQPVRQTERNPHGLANQTKRRSAAAGQCHIGQAAFTSESYREHRDVLHSKIGRGGGGRVARVPVAV